MNFEEMLAARAARAEEVLLYYMPTEAGYGQKALEAMGYSVGSGGKRLRPVLMEGSYQLFGGEGKLIEPFMAAIEMIHNYSLVHDDLPTMDNDQYRRGRKTTWTVYGEGMAVLAGDGLLNLAFETAASAFVTAKDEAELRRIARALQILGNKSGIYGMIGGQSADLEAEAGRELTQELLLYIHEKKTAALIQASMMIGAVLAGAEEQKVQDMEQAAHYIGLAFQIQDDILDVTGTMEVLGKPVGSDVKNHKLTYVALHGIEESVREVKDMSERALAILNRYETENNFLTELVTFLITREK